MLLASLAAGILLIAGSAALALSRHVVTAAASDSNADAAAAAAAAAREQAVRDQAVTWVAGQVSRGTVVSCDPVTCQALRAHGFPTASLLTLRQDTVSPLGSQVIVATQAIRAQFGSLLRSVYAPMVLASFGSGSLEIGIRVVAPHGAAAYLSALRADTQASKQSGRQLLRSQRITASPAARGQLTAGRVDSRLLVTLAGLAAQQPVSVVAFGNQVPGAGPGIPLRSADLAETDSATGAGGRAYVRSMISFLRAQPAPYQPLSVQRVRLPDGQAVLSIDFAAPTPLGLLTPPGT